MTKQNARPKINTKTNVTAEIEFQTVSIFPSGFVSAADLVFLIQFFTSINPFNILK
jgi:hypothetical protein